MAFFKFRQSGENPTPSTRPAENVEVMRQRAKHRLIGAAVLVLVGVVGFPMLFDTQPRPIPVDVHIEMPDKNKVAPLQIPAAAAPNATAVVIAKPASSNVSASASLDPEEQIVGSDAAKTAAKVATASKAVGGLVTSAKSESKPEPKPEPKPESKADAKADVKPVAKAEAKPDPKTDHKTDHKAESKPEPKPEPKKPEVKPEPKHEAKADDGARAKSLLEGKDLSAKAAADDHRFVIQVGAFADAAKARETRQKLERAGLKTYTHVAETKEGQRIRVRVGPFSTKAEAEKTAGKVKGLDLPAAILTL